MADPPAPDPPAPAAPFSVVADGVRVNARVTPRARQDAILGIVADAEGVCAFRVAVTAPPEDGKANRAVAALFAKNLHVAKSAVAVTGGATARRKTLHVAGEPAALIGRLNQLAEQGDG